MCVCVRAYVLSPFARVVYQWNGERSVVCLWQVDPYPTCLFVRFAPQRPSTVYGREAESASEGYASGSDVDASDGERSDSQCTSHTWQGDLEDWLANAGMDNLASIDMSVDHGDVNSEQDWVGKLFTGAVKVELDGGYGDMDTALVHQPRNDILASPPQSFHNADDILSSMNPWVTGMDEVSPEDMLIAFE